MKAKKIASLLLVASIALASSACAVEFSDQNGTVDKVVNALASDAPEAIDTQVSEEKEQKSSLDPITTDSAEETDDTDANDTEETSSADVEIDDKKSTEETSAETTPEVERTIILEDTCIEFDRVPDSNQVYTLDCKHGNFKVEPGDDDIIITFNGRTFELPITWDNKQVWPYGVTYVQRYGFEYIYVESSLETDRGFYHNLNVYKIDGNDITYVNSTDGFSVLSQTMDDPAHFEASLMESEENGFDIRGYCGVGATGLPVLVDVNMWFYDVRNVVSFTDEVSGYIIVNGQLTSDTASVSPDDYVRLIGTDGMTYLDIETKAGVLIRLDWTSIFDARDKNDQFYIAHAIDARIDDRIPSYEF
ncbi:MAG: hypothetical protein K6G47_12015 [Clostridia bacterium]|nr:hypothetical protein [Clostridia bacterium]